MENNNKEVYFDKYCNTCKDKNAKETKDPCNECLDHPSNVNSHKPVNYEDGNKSKGEKL